MLVLYACDISRTISIRLTWSWPYDGASRVLLSEIHPALFDRGPLKKSRAKAYKHTDHPPDTHHRQPPAFLTPYSGPPSLNISGAKRSRIYATTRSHYLALQLSYVVQ